MKTLLVFLMTALCLGAQCISVKDSATWGVTVVGNGVTDDTAALQVIANNSQDKCIAFPPGTYRITSVVRWEKSRVVLQGNHATIQGDNYLYDGFKIGYGLTINTFDVKVTDFAFKNLRIGIWVVSSQRVLLDGIKGDGTAVIASGNDNDSGCKDVVIRRVRRTGTGTANLWYTVGVFRAQQVTISDVFHDVSLPVNALVVNHSNYVSLSNIKIDQINKAGDCVDLSDSTRVVLSNFQLRNCLKGVILYFSAVGTYNPVLIQNQENRIDTGLIADSKYGVVLYSSKNTIANTTFVGMGGASNSAAVFFMTDGRYNHLMNNVMRDQTSGVPCFAEQSAGVAATSLWGGNEVASVSPLVPYQGSNICLGPIGL